MASDVENWSSREVKVWLEEMHMEAYVNAFCDTHKIDGIALLTLSENDLYDIMGKACIGDAKRLIFAIRKLQLNSDRHDSYDPSNHTTNQSTPSPSAIINSDSSSTGSFQRMDSNVSVELDLSQRISRHLEPEYTKLVLSYVYMFSVFLLTAFVMVIVHDRVPDMEKYPPLPDIVLDNLPYIPWAFDMCELTGVTMMFIMTIVLIFHKHRFIIMRRMFSLTGTVFLLRCFTMLITSLSVPGTHLECAPKNFDSLWAKLQRAFVIWQGMGMSLQGVRSCGDYMFSGHTVVVTMLNFFITEYTPRRMHLLHTATWVMNIFGVFFILAAHEHYSIDVFIAFYLTSRLFLYYHSLSNNRVLRQGDHKRTRIWFPMFSYFEARIDGIIPNEFDWPFTMSKLLNRNCDKKKS